MSVVMSYVSPAVLADARADSVCKACSALQYSLDITPRLQRLGLGPHLESSVYAGAWISLRSHQSSPRKQKQSPGFNVACTYFGSEDPSLGENICIALPHNISSKTSSRTPTATAADGDTDMAADSSDSLPSLRTTSKSVEDDSCASQPPDAKKPSDDEVAEGVESKRLLTDGDLTGYRACDAGEGGGKSLPSVPPFAGRCSECSSSLDSSTCSATCASPKFYVKDIEIPVPSNLLQHSYEPCVSAMKRAEPTWMGTPAPLRGEVVRLIGCKVREMKEDLAVLLSVENGKVLSEARGEVQEFIDVCDLAVGLSRQLEGKIITSERPNHMLLEAWHPLGSVGVITAFNFPLAVFGWNLAVALVCGNCVLWKPAETTPLISIALMNVIHSAIRHLYKDSTNHTTQTTIAKAERHIGSGTVCSSLQASTHAVLETSGEKPTGFTIPRGVICLCLDAPASLIAMGLLLNPTPYSSHILSHTAVRDPRLNLICFTGSCAVGREVGVAVQKRFGKVLLELGGNNASVIMGNLDLAIRGSVFAAVGTAGQRCTTLRRLLIWKPIYSEALERLVKAYHCVLVGHPLRDAVHCGPLHTAERVCRFEQAVAEIKEKGANILAGGRVIEGNFVEPTLVEVPRHLRAALSDVYTQEWFVPILFVFEVDDLDEAVQLNNSVTQGLSSSLYSNDLRDIYKWIGPMGSDCGIVNVNVGPSGAEIGGAFGGEKQTGGGRESGSDSWKQYMRRITCTVNCSDSLPLAQGVEFHVADEV